MQYDRQLQQQLDHEHDDYSLINHTHTETEQEIKSVSKDVKNTHDNLKAHVSNSNNPHKVTAEQVGNDKPIWNANKLNGIEFDDTDKRAGWSPVFNGKKFEYLPISQSKFFDHNELTNYDPSEHAKLDDEAISKKRVWSSAKTSKEIARKSDIKHTHKDYEKDISELKSEHIGIAERMQSLEFGEHTHPEVANLEWAMGYKADINHFHNEYATKEHGHLDLEEAISKKASETHEHTKYATKDDLEKSKVSETRLDKMQKDIDDRANWNHRHRIKDVVGLQEALDSSGGGAVSSVDGRTGVVTLTDLYQPLENQRLGTTNDVDFNSVQTPSIQASTSAGLTLKNLSGQDIMLLGAGGGQNATFYDGVKLDSQTATRILATDASKNIVTTSNTPTELSNAITNSHVALTLGTNTATALSLSGQQLSLGDVFVQTGGDVMSGNLQLGTGGGTPALVFGDSGLINGSFGNLQTKSYFGSKMFKFLDTSDNFQAGVYYDTGTIETNGQIKSNIVTGTKPIDVVSTTLNTNLNADLLDGQEGSYYLTDVNQVFTDNTTNDVSTTKHGYTPKAPNDTSKFLRGDGTWAVPSTGGISDGDKGDITVSGGGTIWSIDSGIDATKIGDGSVTSTEFQYINTLSSNAQTQIDGKVTSNVAITGATKTKVTYDSKGLVTAGADATTADIADSSNKRYVTDAQLTVIGNTSGTNTGDQTSIVGITGTKAQFDTAVTDGNFLYVGDVTTVGYSLNAIALNQATTTDAQTMYWGGMGAAPTTTADNTRIYIPKAGTIKAVYVFTKSGTAGSNENWSMYIRKNNTTDTLIQTVGASTAARVFSNTGLSISVAQGDYIEIKEIQPTWATNPANVTRNAVIYIE